MPTADLCTKCSKRSARPAKNFCCLKRFDDLLRHGLSNLQYDIYKPHSLDSNRFLARKASLRVHICVHVTRIAQEADLMRFHLTVAASHTGILRGSEGKSDKELVINGNVEDSNFDSNLDYIRGQNSSSNLRKGVKRILQIENYQG